KFMDENVAALIGWIKIDMLSIRDIAGFPPDGKVTLASAAVEDLSSESMKHFELDRLSVDAPEIAIKLQKFELGDVVWPTTSAIVTIAKLQDAKDKGQAPDPLLADKAAGEFMNIMPRLGKLSINDVEVGVAGGDLFKLDEYLATVEGGTTLLPKTAKAKMSGMVIPSSFLRMTPESAQIFDSLGYKEIAIEGEGEGDHDEATGRYSGQGRVTVKDAGTLSLSHAIGGLTNERLKAVMTPFVMSQSGGSDQDRLLAAAGPISLENFALRFDDASLTKRVLSVAA